MSYIEIDMPEFQKYISHMETVVSNIVHANRVFSNHIVQLEEQGWRDDVYKVSRNQLFRLQETTNQFISGLDTIDSSLIVWFGRIHTEYSKEEFAQLQINMERVEVLSDVVPKGDSHYRMSVETLDAYVDGTNNYINQIRDELSEFEKYHAQFAESFHTSKYEELTETLKQPIAKMNEVLYEMEKLVALVSEKRDILWELT